MVQPQTLSVPNYSGVNIQIFNPSVATPGTIMPATNYAATANYQAMPSYPPNYYTQNMTQTMQPVQPVKAQATVPVVPEKKKTEKREVVQLTDDYIKNLENYLNDKRQDYRLMGAKEVLLRFQEDDSRKNDLALNALNNKMLQDPYTPIRVMAMAALDSGVASGDDYTVKVLKNMQNNRGAYGEDSYQASNLLLKMSGKKVEKEFEVKDKPKK